MTGPEMMIASLVKILGLKAEIANEAISNVNGRVNNALVHFDARLKTMEDLLREIRDERKPVDRPLLIEEKKEAAE